VNLLLRLNRPGEALEVARKYLAKEDERQISCPGITELCRRTGNYDVLTDVARQQGNPLNFLVGLLS
jgi:hypothetical protein